MKPQGRGGVVRFHAELDHVSTVRKDNVENSLRPFHMKREYRAWGASGSLQ